MPRTDPPAADRPVVDLNPTPWRNSQWHSSLKSVEWKYLDCSIRIGLSLFGLHTRKVSGHRDRAAYVRVAAVIRDLRRSRGWTQAELADRLGVHQTYVSKIELGERRLDVVEAAALARALSVTVADIMARAGVDTGEGATSGD